MLRFPTFALVVALVGGPTLRADEPIPPVDKEKLGAVRDKGLAWLDKNQKPDGSWGKTYTIAVTSFVTLAYLSATDEPFVGERGKRLLKAVDFLMKQNKEGMFTSQGHSWIHGQGFGTLALSEAYGRSLLCKTKPDYDMKKVRDTVANSVTAIAKQQSTSGGWWYTPNSKTQHEGSTTVCAVQALVSAKNYRIPIDEKVLDKGFDYLKQCQNKDGGFDYSLGSSTSMKEGTGGAVATLGLMKKFDYTVMINGYKFLVNIRPKTISAERFPYYGHFYASMGMHLLWQEYKVDKTFRETTEGYIADTQRDLMSWQDDKGAWPLKSWMKSSGGEDAGYATAYATMTLFLPEARLSIYNRTPPKLPEVEKE